MTSCMTDFNEKLIVVINHYDEWPWKFSLKLVHAIMRYREKKKRKKERRIIINKKILTITIGDTLMAYHLIN